jgi:ketosteroid isomerase-like protein
MSATPRQVVDRLLQALLETPRENMADLFAEDAELETPFAPPGTPPLSGGREGLRARLKAFSSMVEFDRVDGVNIHETHDPEVVVAEYQVHGRVAASGKAFTFPFITVTRVRDGLIVFSRDYSDPLAGALAMDRLPALVAALS